LIEQDIPVGENCKRLGRLRLNRSRPCSEQTSSAR
jgi:hypothetical protein